MLDSRNTLYCSTHDRSSKFEWFAELFICEAKFGLLFWVWVFWVSFCSQMRNISPVLMQQESKNKFQM